MSIVPYSASRESQELVRAYTCPVDSTPLVNAVTLIPCCHKINQAVAEVVYGRMVGEHCEHQGRLCVVCKAPVIAYYADPIVRDLARRTLRLAEAIEGHELARSLPEPRVLPAKRAAEAREEEEIPFPFEILLDPAVVELLGQSSLAMKTNIELFKGCRNPIRREILKTNLLVEATTMEGTTLSLIRQYELTLEKKDYSLAGLSERDRDIRDLERFKNRLRALKEILNFAK